MSQPPNPQDPRHSQPGYPPPPTHPQPPQAQPPQPGYPSPGYPQQQPPQPGYPQPQAPQPGYAQPGYGQPVAPQPYAQPGYPQQQYAQPQAYAQPDPFAYDKFLLNQKILSLGNKYFVYSEHNQPLFFVERPVLRIKSLFGIYSDETKQYKLMSLNQDSAWTIINYGFTLLDHNEQPIGYFKRQGWMSILRRTWKVYNAQGQEIAMANEDSWWKAILRRFTDFGAFFRTNFNVSRPDGTVFGQFIRRFTLADKYVLDLTGDPQRTFDRRIAVGLAVLLDNTERR